MTFRSCEDKPASIVKSEDENPDPISSAEPNETNNEQPAAIAKPDQSDAATKGQMPTGADIVAQLKDQVQLSISQSQAGEPAQSAAALQQAAAALQREASNADNTLNAEQRQSLGVLKNIVQAYVDAVAAAARKTDPAEHNAELDKGKGNIDKIIEAAKSDEYKPVAEQLKILLDKWRRETQQPRPAVAVTPGPTAAELRAAALVDFKKNFNERYRHFLRNVTANPNNFESAFVQQAVDYLKRGNSPLDGLNAAEIRELDKNMNAFVKSISQEASL
jgi:hypothetical protein